MTDGPQACALPGCSETVEQPDDGGPRRLYCSPAHRAAARKMRHAARMDAATPQPDADLTQPIARAPEDQQSEQPTTELPAPLGVTRKQEPEPDPVPDREWSPAAAWTVSPPTLPPAPSGRTVRTITSKRVKKQKPARTAGERKNATTHMRRRAIASVAIASLVAGGASYFVTENVIPTTPTTLPPQAAQQPTMEADVWAGKAEVVLASLGTQLDAVAQAEASWLALPEQRRAQEPAAVQALKDRKALLEQQRATLTSQLEALKTLPDRTTELTQAQAQLDAVERTLNESTTTAASPDYQEALRQLESQRDIRRQQRDHAAQALTDLRNGVEQALNSPLPAEKDETAPIVERVKAVVEGRPDPGEKDDDQGHNAADGQDPATAQRREDGDEGRGDVGTTAPPDPERPNTPDILADGGRDAGSDAERGSQGSNRSDGDSGGPVQSVAGALGSVLGQGDTSNRDESANRRESRADESSENSAGQDSGGGNTERGERGNDRGGLGDVVRGVTGGLLGGSDRDDRDDDARRGRSDDRDDAGDSDRDDDRNERSSRWSDRDDRDDDDRDDRSSRRERDDDDDDDDRGGLRGIADGLLGGGDDRDDDGDDDEHADEDREHKRPSGKAERKREKDREESENRHDKDDSDKDGSDKDDDEHADEDREHKRPSGKAERKREKDREESKQDRGDKDDDEKSEKKDKDDNDDDGDDGKSEKKDKDDDGDDDGGKSKKKDKDDDGGDDDGGDSDGGDSDGGDDD